MNAERFGMDTYEAVRDSASMRPRPNERGKNTRAASPEPSASRFNEAAS